MKKDSNRKETGHFLRFLVRKIPEIEPPDGFAFRVSRAVRPEPVEFSVVIQSMARKLVPVFMSLSILASAAAYLLTTSTIPADFGTELLFESPAEEEEITIEYVLDNLGPLPGGKTR